MKKILASLCVAAVLTSCGTVTFTKEKTESILTSSPAYEDSKSYFLGGLVGTSNINTTEICGDKNVEQFQSTATPLDMVLTYLTAGIYSPKSAKVWCQQ